MPMQLAVASRRANAPRPAANDSRETGKNCSKLAEELAAVTGGAAETMAKVIAALGIDRNMHEAAILLGRPLALADLVIGYRVPPPSDVA